MVRDICSSRTHDFVLRGLFLKSKKKFESKFYHSESIGVDDLLFRGLRIVLNPMGGVRALQEA